MQFPGAIGALSIDAGPKQPPQPPRFCAPEPAIKHVYDYQTRTWQRSSCMVRLSSKPFNAGTLRIIYHMLDSSLPEDQQHVVAKVAKDPNERPQSYFTDVMMQGKAKQFADAFNERKPPKFIDFVLPYIVEFKNRRAPCGGNLVMGVEPYINGEYEKYTNNFGFVHEEDRNTPQAFSHFTYHHSKHRMLVCDIQGVGDMYTDPQIHSADGSQRWGKADLGQQGIQKFFSTHLCNAICEFMELPLHSGKKRLVGLPADVKKAAAVSRVFGNGASHKSVGQYTGMLLANAALGSGAPVTGVPLAVSGPGVARGTPQLALGAPQAEVIPAALVLPESESY